MGVSVFHYRLTTMNGFVIGVVLALVAAIIALQSDQLRLAEPIWMLLFGVALLFVARAARKHFPRRGGQPG
jgi:hypothetical protein